MIKFQFTRIQNQNNPIIYKCTMFDGQISIDVCEFARGGKLYVVRSFHFNTDISLEYNIDRQVESWNAEPRRHEQEIAECLLAL